MLVAREDDGRLATLRDLDRSEFVGEAPRRVGLGPAPLALEREPVLVLARDAVLPRHVLRGLAHREGMVDRRETRIHEPPADRRVVELLRAAERLFRLPEDERRAAHRLDAARDDHLAATGLDHARRDMHGLEARRAQPIHRRPRDARGKPREKRRHARDIAVVLARLVRRAEVDLVDRRGVDARARDRRTDRVRREIVGPHGGERAAIAADGSADGGDDGGAA